MPRRQCTRQRMHRPVRAHRNDACTERLKCPSLILFHCGSAIGKAHPSTGYGPDQSGSPNRNALLLGCSMPSTPVNQCCRHARSIANNRGGRRDGVSSKCTMTRIASAQPRSDACTETKPCHEQCCLALEPAQDAALVRRLRPYAPTPVHVTSPTPTCCGPRDLFMLPSGISSKSKRLQPHPKLTTTPVLHCRCKLCRPNRVTRLPRHRVCAPPANQCGRALLRPML